MIPFAALFPFDLEFLTDPQFWKGWVRIVLLDLVLAGDNALVIALAVRSLPARQQLWGRVFGTIGAVVLRLIFVVAITWLLQIPLLRLVGGLALIWIAFKLVGQSAHTDEQTKAGTSLREAIGIIIVADVVMSFDNVMAISAAAKGDMTLVVFGLLLSLPLVVWGSGVLAHAMNRFRIIIWLGGGVLGWVAMEMMLEDPLVRGWIGETVWQVLHHYGAGVLAVGITGYGWWLARGTPRAMSQGK